MKIVFVFGHMFNVQTWSTACAVLKEEGIQLHLFSQQQSAEKAIEFLENEAVDIFIGQLFNALPLHDDLLEYAQKARMRVGLSWDMSPAFSTISEEQVGLFNQYLAQISVQNYVNGIKYLACLAGSNLSYEEPQPVQNHGIYHPESQHIFSDLAEYQDWFSARPKEKEKKPMIGITCYFGQIVENNKEDIDAVIQGIEEQGMMPLCVCSEGAGDASLSLEKRYPWLDYFEQSTAPDSHRLAAIINMMAGRLLSQPDDAFIFEDLNVPVFQMIRLYQQGPEDWADDKSGLGAGSYGLIYGLAQPEMAGVIEPSMGAGTVPEWDSNLNIEIRHYLPVKERIQHLCRRIKRWLKLQTLPNAEKRVTIVLNNNPCKGVEATLGVAAGLDTFESLAGVIRAMREAGYHVGDAPENGRELSNRFLERKAISEFRWTTVDEIVDKGGALHLMNRDEYQPWFDRLPEAARKKVLADWDAFPGQGMAYREKGEDVLVITGLEFGNLKIMIQPKRGCYGPKCNGEVCRILHDPELSPPHHWLAVYHYIHKTSDVMIHFGTHGALEFLPGKRAALSKACFSEISLGELPNLYLYIMDVPGDGVVAKRRGRAVMIDHLTPAYHPATLDDEMLSLEQLLKQYISARENREEKRKFALKDKMLPLMQSLNFTKENPEDMDFDAEVELLERRLKQIRRTLSPSGMHILGTSPDVEKRADMLATILMKPSQDQPRLEEIANTLDNNDADTFKKASNVLKSIINEESKGYINFAQPKRNTEFIAWCRDISAKIAMSTREIPELLRALNGEYMEPGLSGSLSLGQTQALPTGRNFYTTDVQSLPTRTAWEVGTELAHNLLKKYIREENRFPESVGISLWSIDAFKSDGEVFCQILHLMGMRPVWDLRGRVISIEPIPLDSLSLEVDGHIYTPRPRIDVVIQTSGILRDMVPHFTDFLDQAAVLASNLEESPDVNFIRKHTDERLSELKSDLKDKFTDSEMARMASFRVFSSAPGTYGIGVGLALDASAWEDEQDLAETHVNWGGYAYGSAKAGNFQRVSGQEAHKLYAANLKNVDVTYMRQYSPEYDLVDCGCYAGFLGGMSVAAKAVGSKSSKIYWADNNPSGDLSVRDLKDDLEVSVTAKLFNKNWIHGRKEHGYKGAGSVSSRVNNLFKWSATTQKVDKWVFDKVVETYIQDRENLNWLRSANPYALEELTRRLLEAQSRGLWQADPDMLEEVRQTALMVEGDMEEIMGEVKEEFQGSKVDVLTSSDVEKWQQKWHLGD